MSNRTVKVAVAFETTDFSTAGNRFWFDHKKFVCCKIISFEHLLIRYSDFVRNRSKFTIYCTKRNFKMSKMILLLCFLLISSESSSAVEINPCELDVAKICGTTFPDTYQSTYDTRLCLRENIQDTSKECQEYLTIVSPSIIEPCFDEIEAHCLDISPGGNRVHSCLTKFTNQLSAGCSAALFRSPDKNTNFDSIVITKEEQRTVDDDTYYTNSFFNHLMQLERLQTAMTRISTTEMTTLIHSLIDDLYSRIDALEDSLQSLFAEYSDDDALSEATFQDDADGNEYFAETADDDVHSSVQDRSNSESSSQGMR
jgi:hypothetical protein